MTAAAAVTAAGVAILQDAGPAPALQSTDLRDLIRAVTSGFKALESKTSRLQGAVEHLTSLVTTNTGKVDGLSVRMQAAATAQATTSSTLVHFREQISGALAATASASPGGHVASNSGESPGVGALAADDDAEKRALVISVRVLFERCRRSVQRARAGGAGWGRRRRGG